MSVKWKSLTERDRKHKNEYLKAGETEIAFGKAQRNVIDKTKRDNKKGSK